MTTRTPTLTDFLLARIAEDEAVARAAISASGLSPWRADSYRVTVDDGFEVAETSAPSATHIARHDPARVLAECKAKRAISRAHAPVVANVEWWDAPGAGRAAICPSCRPEDPTEWPYPADVKPDGFVPAYTLAPCPTLRALASVYADHPDFNPDWS